ncbi:MAG: leucine-rich repeat protein [Clostridia bacterium]|nr:leucine-rich repeat protein [Clostridia bacterium]
MKTKMKWTRILALGLIVVMLCLTLASCGGNKVADASGTAGTLGWNYVSDTKTLTITGVGAMPEVESSEDVAWTSVREGVQKIVVSEGITAVSDYAFYGMNSMTEVELPASLKAIGDFSFAYSQKLVTVEIPSGVESIGESAFEGCGSLGSVFVPSSVKTLGERAFAFCHSMTSAVIAGEPEEIGAWTFKNCTSLENLVISDKLTEDRVDATAFEDAAEDFASAEKNSNPNGESTITIHYVTDGETVTETHDMEYGESYYYPTPAKDGYTADATEVSGTANGADRTVTVTYTKDAEAEEEEAPVEEEEEEKNMTTIVIGIVIFAVVLIGIGVGAFFLLRSDKKGKNGSTVRKNTAPKNGKKK